MNVCRLVIFLFIHFSIASKHVKKNIKLHKQARILPREEKPRKLTKAEQLEQLTSFSGDNEYQKCDYLLLDNLIEREIENKNIAIELISRHPKCEWIHMSCCTHSELDKLFEKFDHNIKRVIKRFELLKDTFRIYNNNKKKIEMIIRHMNPMNEMCAETKQKEVLMALEDITKAAKYNEFIIDEYLKYFIDYQKGFVCGLCDAQQQQYMYIDDVPHFILNGHQCLELFHKNLSFLTIQESVHQLGTLVKAMECTKENNFNEVFTIKKTLFEDGMDNLMDCYDSTGSQLFEKSDKCSNICKEFGTFNVLPNTNKIFTFIFAARDYYYLYLDPEESYVPYNKSANDRLSIHLVDTVHNQKPFLENYVIAVDAENGFFPHFNVEYKSNDLDANEEEGISIQRFSAIIALLFVLFR